MTSLRYAYFNVDDPKQSRITIQLWDGEDLRGAIFLRRDSVLPDDPEPHTPCWQVSAIEVNERFRRQGYATRLYEEATRQAAKQGTTICSDVPGSLDPRAAAFWEKQVQKGRAYWEVPGPAEREGWNYDYGRFVIRTPTPPTLSGQGAPDYDLPDVERQFFLSPAAPPSLKKLTTDLLWYLYSPDKGGQIDEYGMWDMGGCWLLAQALHDLIPGSSMHWLVGTDFQKKERGPGPQHVMTRLGDFYLDGNGIYTKSELFQWWRDHEQFSELSLKPFDPDEARRLSVWCPANQHERLLRDLNKYLEIP